MATRRFAPTAPGRRGFTVTFKANKLIRLTDSVSNKFVGGAFQTALSEVHERVADDVQHGMVQRLEEKVAATGRVQRGDERLRNSLLDERNRDVSASMFTVGRPMWLDKSPAAVYWRRIEEGDTQTFDTVGGAFFTSGFGRGSFQVANPALKGLGAGGKGKGAMRMPQRQALAPRILDVGPYPAYKYTLGGKKRFDNTDMAALYRTALSTRGIDMARHKK